MMASLTHRRRGKQKRQSQALHVMEHLRLALRVVIGQACEIAAAFQGIGLVSGRLVGHRWLLIGSVLTAAQMYVDLPFSGTGSVGLDYL